MKNYNKALIKRIDLRAMLIILALMFFSLIIISSSTIDPTQDLMDQPFITPLTHNQIQWFVIGWGVFFIFTWIDYNKLREWTWFLYLCMILALIGVFFSPSVNYTQRWYVVPYLNIYLQPSEFSKVIIVIMISWILEKRRSQLLSFTTLLIIGFFVTIPFLLILKQPDLGTALVLYPITLVVFYFGGLHPKVVKVMAYLGCIGLCFCVLIFIKVIPYEDLKPYATLVMKDYQYERLNPSTHHQQAAETALSIGGFLGNGWRQTNYTHGGWLPYPYTDSVFPALGEIYGLVGLLLLILLFYFLLFCCFQVTVVAKDYFGRLLAAGISVHLSVHVMVNLGMMCGFLPITGVPLILVTYGGSSIVSTMMALGILQSIYIRRFMF